MYDKILVPLDGSERGERTLTQLKPLLDAGDTIVLLSVVEIPEFDHGNMDIVGGARQTAERYLEKLAGTLGANVNTVVRIGDPATEILQTAKELGVKLVAMASHGYRGLARAFYGSVTERVLRGCAAPVLVVRSLDDQGSDAPLALKNIVVPLDGSKDAERVLPDAVALAHRDNGALHVVRVRPGFPATPFYAPSPELLAAIDVEESYLDNVAAYLREDGLTVHTAVLVGGVADQLGEYVKEIDADLLAMTTHGRTGFERWLLGSTAEELIRSHCAPLLVRRVSEA